MNKKFLNLVLVGVVVSVGSYYALNHFAPYQKEQLAVEQSVTVDEVYGGGLQEPSAPAAPDEASDAAPQAAAEVPADETVADEAAPEPAETVAAAEPVTEPEPAVENPAPVQASAPAPAKKSAPKPAAEAADAKPAAAPKAWWGKEDPEQLSIVTATSMSASKAIALMFNGAFDDASSADAHIKVLNAKGAALAGQWAVSAKNKRMLTFTVQGPGSYTVSVKAGLTDKAGRKFPQDKSGPVQVQ